jgi:hypothetical protein
MEKLEVDILARKRILDEAEEGEKRTLLFELETEERRLYQAYKNLQSEIKDRRERQLILDKARAIKAIGKIHLLMKARKQIRQKCREVYEKRFDENYHTYYYINRQTGETSWERPKIFGNGSFDIDPEEGWIILRDAEGFPYYFNPKTMRMCWDLPPGVLICQKTVSHTWWKLFPAPLGRCFNFATMQSDIDGLLYCDDCWQSKWRQQPA